MRIIRRCVFVVALSFSLTALGASEEQTYAELSAAVKAKRTEVKNMESACTNPQDTCAFPLGLAKSELEELEKQLAQKSGDRLVEGASQSESQQLSPEQKKAVEASKKKVKKQKRFWQITAVINGGVGAYLLYNHCSPNGTPPNYSGCVLGPLALGQAYLSYRQVKKLKKLEDQLSHVENPKTEGPKTTEQTVSAEESTEEDLTIGDQKVSEMAFPCPDNSKMSCIVDESGTGIRPIGGGPSTSLAALAANVPNTAETRKALSGAIKTQKELEEEAKKTDPDFQSMNRWASGFPVRKASTTGSRSGSSGDNTPALSLPSSAEEWEFEDEEEEFSSPSQAQFAGHTSGGPMSYPGEPEDDLDEEVQKILSQFGIKKPKPKETSKGETKSISHGKDTISSIAGNMFSIIKGGYDKLRNRGEFIEGRNIPRNRNTPKNKKGKQ